MKFTTVASDAFQKFQLNAGIILTEFDPDSPTVDRSKIFIATSGGTSFSASPEFIDFGDDVDNIPANTMELKVLQSVSVTLSGTGKTVDSPTAKRLMAAADVDGNKITPRQELRTTDFDDIWWVGDYSDVNADEGTGQNAAKAGFIAIKIKNALNTGGFSISSNDEGKGDIGFEFTGHYSIDDLDDIPYEVYIEAGTASA